MHTFRYHYTLHHHLPFLSLIASKYTYFYQNCAYVKHLESAEGGSAHKGVASTVGVSEVQKRLRRIGKLCSLSTDNPRKLGGYDLMTMYCTVVTFLPQL